ncbi:chemotaxis protein CheW [Agarilytica rhodophyticola]|uniref:chemotaxis protein CheW n=1 Tax=Agarilytica rhodophyticola TaxID=1737490 RepID=UPI001FE50F82|nr:chemotaxis protein CheW [Agarilytica rhodophyticola]
MVDRPIDDVLQVYFNDLLGEDREDESSQSSLATKQKRHSPIVVTENKSRPRLKCVPSPVKKEADTKKIPEVDLEKRSHINSKDSNAAGQHDNDSQRRPVTKEKDVDGYITDHVIAKKADTSPPASSPEQQQNTLTLEQKRAELKKAMLPPANDGVKPPPANHTIKEKQRQCEHPTQTLLESDRREKLQQLLDRQTMTELMPTSIEVEAPAVDHALTTEEKTLDQSNANTDIPTKKDHLLDDKISSNVKQAQIAVRPSWAQEDFEVLLFEVSGLSLAVPLVALGQIVPIDDKLTSLTGQSKWFMGILPSHVGDIRTVNTSLFVMPERHKDGDEDKAKYVVTIDGMPWGLAVDAVNQPIKLSPNDVKWRNQRTKRPWLAGTVKSHMCALIDIPQMALLLEQCDKNRDA